MTSYHSVLKKLEGFTKKFYLRELIKGALLFATLGILFWVAITSLEFMLWLDAKWRLGLFSVFMAVELFLLYRFIIVPLFFIFKIRRGLSNREASTLIGKHFPEVEDKLYNLLDMADNPGKSELLEASIEQRSKKLGKVPFREAIDFGQNRKYAGYLIVPALILVLFWLTGNIDSLFESHKRVVNYDLAYERPAPFSFDLLNSELRVLDNESLPIEFIIDGEWVPENASIVFGDESLLMRRNGNRFSYVIQPSANYTEFHVTANGWRSKPYKIERISTPAITDFQMKLQFPKYLNKKDERIIGTGNTVVPEGTIIGWKIGGASVDSIVMRSNEGIDVFEKSEERFFLTKQLFKDFDYAVSTSNANIKDYESLEYALKVVKDASPKIKVEQQQDSINPNQSFYRGQVSDDHGLKQVWLVYYPREKKDLKRRLLLESPRGNLHQFYYTFPSGIEVEEGLTYSLYFEVVDNDGLRGGKITRSNVFNSQIFDYNQLKKKELEVQNNLVRKLDMSIDDFKKQKELLTKINEQQKESNGLNFEEKNRIKDFLQKQKDQESLMEKFSKRLKESLKNGPEDSELKKLLQERLERQELEAKKNERLLEELNKLADKIDKEELKKRLEELGKKQNAKSKNLEQILELTKRYYVTEKMAQLSNELAKLAQEQKVLSEKNEQGTEDQKKLNNDFKEFSGELDELRKDNKELKKPLEIDIDEQDERSVKEDQNKALELLENTQNEEETKGNEDAKKRQNSAGQKMKEMSDSLKQSAASGGGSSDTEDAEMLRQILDNLVTFSFKQEQLFESVEQSDVDVSRFGKMVRDQKELRGLFEHVDDSLFSLSLRRAELSEFVNTQIEEVYYNIDKTLESLSENQVFQGASYQQYVMNATNALSDFLANILENMQQSMQSGKGKGGGGPEFQLPDIIKGQEGLQERMNGSGQGKLGQGKEGERGDNGGEKDSNGSGKGEKGKKTSGGQEGRGSDNGQGNSGQEELGLSEVYEIYKEQQFLRNQLEKQLDDIIKSSDRELAKKLLRQMQDFENDLIENGITQRTRSKVNSIQHQLLKLKDATLKQGNRKERESKTDIRQYQNPIITKPEQLQNTRNEIEILNRQALPLRHEYNEKVKTYFRND